MRNVVAIFVASSFITGCAAENKCSYFSEKYYDDGLKYYLSKQKVPFKASSDSICVSAKDVDALKEAEAQIQRYFREVALRPVDACAERALVEWAKKANLRYDLGAVVDSHNQPSGNLFFLRSFTHEEVVANRERLANDAPKNAKCGKDK